jgi:hypothetical protein
MLERSGGVGILAGLFLEGEMSLCLEELGGGVHGREGSGFLYGDSRFGGSLSIHK